MKLRLWLVCAAAGAFAATATTPSLAAPDDDMRADVQCLMVSAAAAESSDPTVAKAAPLAAIYFLGRIDGRDPQFDIEAAILAEAKRTSPDDLRKAAMRCGELLKGRGQALQQIGQDLKRLSDGAGGGGS